MNQIPSYPQLNKASTALDANQEAAAYSLARNINGNNDLLAKNLSRLENALSRIGHTFPPENTAKGSAVAVVPQGHIGAIREATEVYLFMNGRFNELLNILDSLV